MFFAIIFSFNQPKVCFLLSRGGVSVGLVFVPSLLRGPILEVLGADTCHSTGIRFNLHRALTTSGSHIVFVIFPVLLCGSLKKKKTLVAS